MINCQAIDFERVYQLDGTNVSQNGRTITLYWSRRDDPTLVLSQTFTEAALVTMLDNLFASQPSPFQIGSTKG